MAWEIIYEGNTAGSQTIQSEKVSDPTTLPSDGLQALIVDGKPYVGMDYVGFLDDGGIVLQRGSLIDLQSNYPNLVAVARGRTTDTSRYHRIIVDLGMWSQKDVVYVNNPGWHKSLIGWRLWTSNDVFDSVGVAEQDWLTYWQSLLDTDVQYIKAYENWKTPSGDDFCQIIMGADNYFMAPGPEGWIISPSNDTNIEARYTGAHVKTGKKLSDNRWDQVRAAARVSTTL